MPRKYTRNDLLALGTDLTAPLPAPKKRRNEESQMQRALIGWWHTNCGRFGVHPWLLFSIPNGGGRSGPKVGAILKAEGLRKGAPDLMLAVPTERLLQWKPGAGGPSRSAGLFLELKTKTGILSPEQEKFHELLRDEGYDLAVIRSLEEGIKTITEYLT